MRYYAGTAELLRARRHPLGTLQGTKSIVPDISRKFGEEKASLDRSYAKLTANSAVNSGDRKQRLERPLCTHSGQKLSTKSLESHKAQIIGSRGYSDVIGSMGRG